VSVESERGKGSKFTVQLPVNVQPRLSGKPSVRAAQPPTQRRETEEGEPSPPRILVIDDDPDMRDLISRIMEREGFRVVVAASGQDGLRLARELRPSAITLDIQMPDRDGWSVLAALKADPELADTPVTIISIYEEQRVGYALGAAEYLTKPLSRDRLVQVMRRLVGTAGPVLVIEDEGSVREPLCWMLVKEGWRVIEAENGRAALDLLTDTTPSILLLDLIMPVMDGFQFLEEFRKLPQCEAVPVVVLTAKELTHVDHERLQMGVKQVLQKGLYSYEQIIAQVRGHIVASLKREKPALA
jgi:CheY-like chemotaxis protein